MKCASCGQENPEGRKFCRYCGKPLAGDVRAAVTGGAVNAAGATASGAVNTSGATGTATGRASSAGGTETGGTSSAGNIGWKQAYLDFINNSMQRVWYEEHRYWEETERDNFDGYLIYVDNDAVPELYLMPHDTTTLGGMLLSYHGGRFDRIGPIGGWDNSLSYIPYGGLMLWSPNGHIDPYEFLYSLSGGGFREEKRGCLLDDDYEHPEDWSWEWGNESGNASTGDVVEAYFEARSRDFDDSKAVNIGFHSAGMMSYDELISYLSR